MLIANSPVYFYLAERHVFRVCTFHPLNKQRAWAWVRPCWWNWSQRGTQSPPESVHFSQSCVFSTLTVSTLPNPRPKISTLVTARRVVIKRKWVLTLTVKSSDDEKAKSDAITMSVMGCWCAEITVKGATDSWMSNSDRVHRMPIWPSSEPRQQ